MRDPIRVLILALLLTALRGVLAILTTPSTPSVIFLAWLALADMVLAGVFVALATHSPWRGARLGLAIFTLAFGVGTLGTLIEAVFFRLFPTATALHLAVNAALVAAVAALGVTWLAGSATVTALPASPVGTGRQILRFTGSSLIYTICYLGAGIAVLPFVRQFYATGGLPSGGATLGMQLFIRGPLLVLLGILVVRMTSMTRAGQATLVAAVMVGLGGLAPLLVPNPFMPDAVRWAHLVEITVSNAVFGSLVGWIYSPRTTPPAGI